ncbi:poly(A) RNA polymerase protein 2 [Trichomonascus vanleenenianus]|uniref:non-canonical poly(A) polymerase PAP2 n=1 Tax=Trichomonascus vanleenenianus TaxID=2268995 RepID=UPI003ECA4220
MARTAKKNNGKLAPPSTSKKGKDKLLGSSKLKEGKNWLKRKKKRDKAADVSSKPSNFKYLPEEVNLDEPSERSEESDTGSSEQSNAHPGEGFISLDIELGDNASVHTNTFAAFEQGLAEEDENNGLDYKPLPSASTDDTLKEKKRIRSKVHAMFPWVRLKSNHHKNNVADWLTREIKDFVAYMSPSAEEIKARNEAVRRIRDLVHGLWHDAEAHVFGSYATDMYLPGSDIDMVVLSDSGRYDTKAQLYKLASKLRASGHCKQVEPIVKTRVPIIKMVDGPSNINIDISFEQPQGVTAVNTIQGWAREFPCLRYLVLVIKQFLAKRRMNEVRTGGVGGLSVICMVVSFLRNHPRVASKEIDPMENLGVLLIEFFELYGKNFNYDDAALCMTGEMGYKLKSRHLHLQNANNSFSLSIEDPHDTSNNISRGSFNLRGVKKAFGGAFDILTNRCYELEALPVKKRSGESILGHIIKLKGPQRDFEDSRHVIRNESADVKLARSKSITSLASTSTTGTTISAKQRESLRRVMYVSDFESSDHDSDHSVIEISDDDDSGSDTKSTNKRQREEDVEESRTEMASGISKKVKQDFWLRKSGVLQV